MGKLLALAAMVLAGCGGDDAPTYSSCLDARWTVAEAHVDCGGGSGATAEQSLESAASLIELCDGVRMLMDFRASSGDAFSLCVDGSDFLDILPALCAHLPAACEECAQSFECSTEGMFR